MKKSTVVVLIILFLFTKLYGEEKDLERFMDIVIVKTPTISCLVSFNKNNISLYSYKNNTFEKIPFQIDPKDNKDNFKVNERTATVSKHDELVFMSFDTGNRANEQNILKKFPGKNVLELTVEDQNNKKGWVYLVFNDTPSKRSYIHSIITPTTEKLYSDYYSISYSKNNIFFDSYKISDKNGGNNKNIIDVMKLRFTIVTKLFSSKFTRNEKDLVYKVIGFQKGPVRIIRKVSSRLKVFMGLKSPAVVVDSYYTPYYFVVPSNLSVPFKLSYVAKDAYYRQTISYSDNILGSKFYCNGCNENGLTIDGKMDNIEKNTHVSPHIWGAIIGKNGNYFYRATWSKNMPLIKNLYYNDDKNVIDPVEHEKGVHEICFLLGDAIKLKPKKYTFSLSIYSLPEWNKKILNEALNIRNNPLKTTITNSWGKKICN